MNEEWAGGGGTSYLTPTWQLSFGSHGSTSPRSLCRGEDHNCGLSITHGHTGHGSQRQEPVCPRTAPPRRMATVRGAGYHGGRNHMAHRHRFLPLGRGQYLTQSDLISDSIWLNIWLNIRLNLTQSDSISESIRLNIWLNIWLNLT